MTTLAFRDGIIAADSNMAGGDTRSVPGAVSKLVAGKKHPVVYAGAGTVNIIAAAMRQFERMKTPPWVHDRECDLGLEDGTTVLVLTKSGLLVFGRTGWFRLNPGVFYAAGSGETAALAAMWCGKTAVEAVEIACKVDTNSCLPVHHMSVPRH